MSEKRMQPRCFTRHWELPTGWCQHRLAKKLEQATIDPIENGIQFFGAGGVCGDDTTTAWIVIGLKESRSVIKSILLLPYQQDSGISVAIFLMKEHTQENVSVFPVMQMFSSVCVEAGVRLFKMLEEGFS